MKLPIIITIQFESGTNVEFYSCKKTFFDTTKKPFEEYLNEKITELKKGSDNVKKIAFIIDEKNQYYYDFENNINKLVCYSFDDAILKYTSTKFVELNKYYHKILAPSDYIKIKFEETQQKTVISLDFDEVNYQNNGIEITGRIKISGKEKNEVTEFEPDEFLSEETKTYWDENWEKISEEIIEEYNNQ